MPFLVSLLPREAWAQTAPLARRYISLFSDFDYGSHKNWFPSIQSPPQQLVSPDGDRTLRYAALKSYLPSATSPLSTVFGSHLNQHLNQINLLRGLDQSTRIGHGNAHILGNMRATDGHDTEAVKLLALRTIDQVIRDNTRVNSINKDVAIFSNGFSRSWRQSANGIVNAPVVARDPAGAYNYLFNAGQLPETGGQTIVHPRASQLNGVMEDYRAVRGGRQISAADKITLDNVLDKLSDVQKVLSGQTSVTGSCRYKSISTVADGNSWSRSTATLKAFADVITAAVMCDVTRVFHIPFNLDTGVYDVNPTADFHQGHSHVPWEVFNGKPNWQYMGEIQNEMVKNFLKPLLDGLAGAVDPANGKSYLYNSLVHYTAECGQVHGLNSQPCFLAGNAGGNLTSGYYLDYSDPSRPHTWVADTFVTDKTAPQYANEFVGVPYNRAFNTILQGMGLTPQEYENPAINAHFQNRTDSLYGARNNNIASMGGYGHWGPETSNYGAAYIQRQALYDLKFFKRVLPMPTTSAA